MKIRPERARAMQMVMPAILSGILLGSGWYEQAPDMLMFVAFVPLLHLERTVRLKGYSHLSLFLFSSVSFFLWNILTTWWIINASVAGFLGALLINSTEMSLVFWLFHRSARIAGKAPGYLLLILYWTAFEYFSLNTNFGWPWLNMGNGLAHSVPFIQWYEYTGSLGGTVWILSVNVVLYKFLHNFFMLRQKFLQPAVFLTTLVFVPALFSVYLYHRNADIRSLGSVTVRIVQPCFDPYGDQRSTGQRAEHLIRLARPLQQGSPVLILGPESTFRGIDNLSFPDSYACRLLRQVCDSFSGTTFILGAEWTEIAAHDSLPQGSGQASGEFDSAIMIGSYDSIPVYHKSKLVPGIETMPYPGILRFLGRWAEYFGGISGSLGKQDEREVFPLADSPARAAPVICYESAFGEHVGGFMRAGANLLLILTNDGWWGDTPGHRQHLQLARLRAIESRKTVCRAANTGISCIIDTRGNPDKILHWSVEGSVDTVARLYPGLTFYVKYGDFTGRISSFFSILFLLYTLSSGFIKKGRKLP